MLNLIFLLFTCPKDRIPYDLIRLSEMVIDITKHRRISNGTICAIRLQSFQKVCTDEQLDIVHKISNSLNDLLKI